MSKTKISFAVLILALAASAFAVPLRWTVETSRAQPATFEAYQGETLELEAALTSYGKPLEAPSNYSLYWQTNGMGSTWWSSPVSSAPSPTNVLFATWSPTNDVGAKTYTCFIGQPGTIYHAAFQLRLRPSPGAVPNELPLPAKTIDFSQVVVTNAPWITEETDPTVPAWAKEPTPPRSADGSARPLPKYLHALDFDDSYPDDAAWYYSQQQNIGGCSSVRDGNTYSRNYDWKFDDAAEFVIRCVATAPSPSCPSGRFASIGVANVGTNLTEQFVSSGKFSRYYKCLPGHTVDGINSEGVVCNINVVTTNGAPWEMKGERDINALGAVRWVLDTASSAEYAASNLAFRVFIPESLKRQGFSAHFMIADKDSTYIVENGVYSNVTGRAVMTNFPLLPTRGDGEGQERYDALMGGANITSQWWTLTYTPSGYRASDLPGITGGALAQLFEYWENNPRESHRGESFGGVSWWQTVHTSVYDIQNRTLRIAVQEIDDWYTFSLGADATLGSVVKVANIDSPDGTFQDRRVQIGENAQAIGVTDGGRNQSIAIGFNAEASGMTSIAIGSGGSNADGTANAPKARGGNSVAIGYDAEAETQSVSVGQSAKTKRGASVAIGLRATAYGQHDIAIGTDAVVTNWFKTTIEVITNGTEIVTNTVVTTNTYNYSVAIGKGAVVKANNSVQIGAGMNTKGNTIKFQDKYLATENYVSDNYQPKGSYLTEEVDPTVPEWAKAENPPAETDPTVPAWAKAENPPAETDPTVPEWAKNPTPPVTEETDPTVPAWAKAENPPAETDPTVPAWAKAENPPEAMPDNALVMTNGSVVTKDGTKTITADIIGSLSVTGGTSEVDALYIFPGSSAFPYARPGYTKISGSHIFVCGEHGMLSPSDNYINIDGNTLEVSSIYTDTSGSFNKITLSPSYLTYTIGDEEFLYSFPRKNGTIVVSEEDPTVPSWAKNPTPPVTQETDPTVPAWAKETSKPTYTASEVGAATHQDVTNKFDEIGPVKSDWNINEGKTSIGSEAEATGRRSTAIGAGTKAQSPNSIVMGTYAVSTNGNQAIAIGNQANGSATNSTAIGNLAQAIDYNGIAIGSGAKANKRYSIAIGDGAKSDTAIKGIAIGSNAASDSQETVVIGANASVGVRSTKSIAIGSGAKVNVNKSGAKVAVQIGTGTNQDEGTIQFLDKKLATENYVDTIVSTWESFLDGSNVVFSITNYISGTYDLSAAKFRILELRPGETNYTEVYNSRDEILLHIADYNTKTVQPQIVELRGEFENGLAEKADRAWGKYTSSGGVAPSNQVYMTAPHTVFAGGMEYERVAVGEGAICVLTTKGAPVYTQGDEGSFKFQDANGTNYFGFAKTDSYVIGVEADGISVSSGIVTLEYNVTMSGVPCIWYCPSLDTLPISWEMLNTSDGSPVPGASHVVQWDEDPPVGKRVCYINCPEPKGFFRATIEEPGEAKFMTNMPADLSGGIICTNEATGVNGVIRPIFDGSSVRWEWSMK